MNKILLMGLVVGSVAMSVQTGVAAESRREAMSRAYRWTPLHWAVRYGEVESARELAVARNLEARDELGRTPLHIAAMFGVDDMVALLLERGADVNARDQWGTTPLRRLELVGQFRGWDRSEIADMLRAAGGKK